MWMRRGVDADVDGWSRRGATVAEKRAPGAARARKQKREERGLMWVNEYTRVGRRGEDESSRVEVRVVDDGMKSTRETRERRNKV